MKKEFIFAGAGITLITAGVLFSACSSDKEPGDFYDVTKVTDGDTIHVLEKGKDETIRIIGINSPETVDPRREVECFGREASNEAKRLLAGHEVRLEDDPTQSDRDRYGRELRYVYLEDGTDFGLKMIQNGYAYEATYDGKYQHQKEYKDAQKEAERKKVGLWSDSTCAGQK